MYSLSGSCYGGRFIFGFGIYSLKYYKGTTGIAGSLLTPLGIAAVATCKFWMNYFYFSESIINIF